MDRTALKGVSENVGDNAIAGSGAQKVMGLPRAPPTKEPPDGEGKIDKRTGCSLGYQACE